MKASGYILMAAVLIPLSAAADVPDAAKPIVEAIKTKYPELKTYCALDDATRRKEVFAATSALAQQGKIKGDPMAIGPEAGAAMRAECEKLAQSK